MVKIGERKIGFGQRCFIIAEAGVNHNGRLDMARQLVDVASKAGASAVKFQTFKAEKLVTPDAPKAAYQLQSTDPDQSQYEMLSQLVLSEDQHRDLFNYCRDRNILFLSTPFDEDSADFLEELGVPAYKIPSGEITNIRFLEHVARKGRPMIVSTGMSNLSEVEKAVQAIQAAGNNDIVLLHCVSNYPALPKEANLRAMHTMIGAFGLPVGFSDHTLGLEVALAAAALGACVIEKHFTLDRNLPGPDHKASLESEQLTTLVKGIRTVESALGSGRKIPTAGEMETAAKARKSFVALTDIPAGQILSRNMLTLKRPGTGLPPHLESVILGRRTAKPIKSGSLISLDMLA